MGSSGSWSQNEKPARIFIQLPWDRKCALRSRGRGKEVRKRTLPFKVTGKTACISAPCSTNRTCWWPQRQSLIPWDLLSFHPTRWLVQLSCCNPVSPPWPHHRPVTHVLCLAASPPRVTTTATQISYPGNAHRSRHIYSAPEKNTSIATCLHTRISKIFHIRPFCFTWGWRGSVRSRIKWFWKHTSFHFA